MEQENAVTTVSIEQKALQVSYDVLGTRVSLDLPFVKKYLVRGRSEFVTDQELVMFINTCKMQRLNPLANGEVYLIKYGKEQPAQMVVGKDAYTKRAFCNPNYIGKKDGIVVLRGNDVVKKEGCCLYPTEHLIGGWCRVVYMRNGQERDAYKEVDFSEYNKGQSTWKEKPATMINKVAQAQCLRDAFPADFEGLYSESELVASGVIEEKDTGVKITTPVTEIIDEDGVVHLPEEDRVVTAEERKEMFAFAQKVFGKDAGNAFIKNELNERELESSTGLLRSQYDEIMAKIGAEAELREQEENNIPPAPDYGETEF